MKRARFVNRAARRPSQTAAAPGVAAINAIGNLSGYFGPFVMGWIKDLTGDFRWGLVTIGACAVVALVITLLLGHDAELEKAPQLAGQRGLGAGRLDFRRRGIS